MRFFYAENASRHYDAAGLRIEFQNYAVIGGTARGVFQARTEQELSALLIIAAKPENAVKEIAESEYMAKIQGAVVDQGSNPLNEVLIAPRPIGERSIIQLGGYGDIINILPIAKDIYDQTGDKPWVIVKDEFASVLDGVNYARKDTYHGPISKAVEAIEARHGPDVIMTQTSGPGYSVPVLTESYSKEAWRLAGYLDKWGNLPLVFDNRNLERESKLPQWSAATKVVLTYLRDPATPYPYPKARWLIQEIQGKSSAIVDLSTLKPEHIYDFLGLIDRAGLLITIDSWPLHLAAASDIPVVALIQDRPNPWFGTVPRCNVIHQQRYSEPNLAGIYAAIEGQQ